MAFKSYLIKKFDTTHENEFFHELSNSLKDIFAGNNELVVLIGNISINGALMDAMIIKNDYWGIIDFKNYGGELEADKDNPWFISKGDEKVEVKGSNAINPFQQIWNYKKKFMEFYDANIKYYFDSKNNSIIINRLGCIVLFHNKIKILKQNFDDSPYFRLYDFDKFLEVFPILNRESMNFMNADIEFILIQLNVSDEHLYPPIKKKVDFPENKREQEKTNISSKNKKSYLKPILISLISLLLIYFFWNFSISNIQNEDDLDERYLENIRLSRTTVLYLNDNFDQNYFNNIISEKEAFRLITLNKVIVLKPDKINTIFKQSSFSADDNIERIKFFFDLVTKEQVDSVYILGDLGELKNKKIKKEDVSKNIIIKKEFWDSLKSRRNSHFEIINSNSASNFQVLIENKANEVFNN